MSGPSNWATPRPVFEAICRHYGYAPQLDVCAEAWSHKCERYYDLERMEDGLSLPWDGPDSCWCNPPYNNPKPWVLRACYHATVPVIMLLKNDPSTKWFRELLENATAVSVLTDRIQHMPPATLENPGRDNNFTSVAALILPRSIRGGMDRPFRCEYLKLSTGEIWR